MSSSKIYRLRDYEAYKARSSWVSYVYVHMFVNIDVCMCL